MNWHNFQDGCPIFHRQRLWTFFLQWAFKFDMLSTSLYKCAVLFQSWNYKEWNLIFVFLSKGFMLNGRAKNWQKVAYLRRNPSPSVKWKTIAWMIWQDVEVSWIARITFSKRGNGVKIWQKLHFLKWNWEFLKSIYSNRYTTTAKKDWKMIIEFYIILAWLYYEVKVRNEMSLFFGENQYFYKKIIHFFVIGQVKFLKFIVCIYLVLNLTLQFNLHISCRVYL